MQYSLKAVQSMQTMESFSRTRTEEKKRNVGQLLKISRFLPNDLSQSNANAWSFRYTVWRNENSSFNCLLATHERQQEKKNLWQQGQDLWSHLASKSFAFCSSQFNIREPGRAERAGMLARGRMSHLILKPPAKPAQLCGTLSPSFENKEEGLTLAGQCPYSGWTPRLLGLFRRFQCYRSMTRLWHSFFFSSFCTWSRSPGYSKMWPAELIVNPPSDCSFNPIQSSTQKNISGWGLVRHLTAGFEKKTSSMFMNIIPRRHKMPFAKQPGSVS